MNNIKAIKRLLQYRTCLEKLDEIGVERVFSHTLGEETGTSAEQVRKDFSKFRIKGNKRGGYWIKDLISILDETFGKHETQKVILIGMGNIGRALSNYRGFARKKIEIAAAFDIDPVKIGKKISVPVFSLADIDRYLAEIPIHIAILALPESQAQAVCDKLVSCGIKGIMNFAPIVLKVPADVRVNNINLSYELEGLIYHTSIKTQDMVIEKSEG
jgi:redox-sensing transcriptional repressor